MQDMHTDFSYEEKIYQQSDMQTREQTVPLRHRNNTLCVKGP